MAETSLPDDLPTDHLVETIRKAIAPYVGDTMARASTEALGRKVGLNGARVSGEQARTLVEKVAQGLNVFIGRDKAGQVQGEILRLLGPGGAA